MTIFGPLVAPRTSPVAVTFSPSTAMTTGSVRVSPTGVPTLSISMTSPTATFCWVAPARTIAYTAVSFVDTAGLLTSTRAAPWRAPLADQGRRRERGFGAHVGAPRVNTTDPPPR